MANPVDPNLLVRNWRAFGIDVSENSGWQTHNRNAGRPAFLPNGIMIHHTGGDTSNPDLYGSKSGVLWVGRSDLPGPLCLAGVGQQGRIYMQGFGRANHAGTGDSSVLNAVINETVPMDRELRPSKNDVDGNSRFYGFEVMYSGGHPMDARAYMATVKACVIICRMHGWSARSIIGHREWTNTKPDPGNCPMDKFRRDVQAMLDGNTNTSGDEIVTPDDINKIAEAVLARQVPYVDPSTGQISTNKASSLGLIATWIENTIINNSRLQNVERQGQAKDATGKPLGYDWLPAINNKLDGLGAQVSALTAAVAALSNDPDLDEAAISRIFDESLAKAASDGLTAKVTLDPAQS
jgi:hypothetical protein